YVGGCIGYLVNEVDFESFINGDTNSRANGKQIRGYNQGVRDAYVSGAIGFMEKGEYYPYTEQTKNYMNIYSDGNYVGGLFAQLDCDANTIGPTNGLYLYDDTNIYNEGDVEGYDYVGGYFGHVKGCMTSDIDLINYGENMKGHSYVGGLIGHIDSHFNMNQVSIDLTAGNYASIEATGDYVGGLIGGSDTNLTDAYKNPYVIAGHLFNGDVDNPGLIKGGSYVGGLVGFTGGLLGCTSVKNYMSIEATGNYVGGMAGLAEGYSVSGPDGTVDTNGDSSIDIHIISQGTEGYVGGYVGRITNPYDPSANPLVTVYQPSYNYASIEAAGNYVGGFIGCIDGTIQTLHSEFYNGMADCDTTIVSTGTTGYVSGYVGYLKTVSDYNTEGKVENYMDITSSGNDVAGAGFGYLESDLLIDAPGSFSSDGYNAMDNYGSITGKSAVGGVIGYMIGNLTITGVDIDVHGDYDYSKPVNISYEKSDLAATYVGGFVGGIYGDLTIDNNYINIGIDTFSGSGNHIGGFIGFANSVSIKTRDIICGAGNGLDSLSSSYDYSITSTADGGVVGGFAGGFNAVGNIIFDVVNVTNNYNIDVTGVVGAATSMYTGGFVGAIMNYVGSSSNADFKIIDDSWGTGYTNINNHGSVKATGNECVGGIFGLVFTYNFTAKNTTLTSDTGISGDTGVGGLIGLVNSFGTTYIYDGYVDEDAHYDSGGNDGGDDGTVTGTGNYVGGLIGSCVMRGQKYMPFKHQAESRADIKGADYVGGLYGYTNADHKINYASTYSSEAEAYPYNAYYYTFGNIEGGNYVGGWIGYLNNTEFYVDDDGPNGNLVNGSPTEDTTITATGGYVGGFIGAIGDIDEGYDYYDYSTFYDVTGRISAVSFDNYATININNTEEVNFVGGIVGYCTSIYTCVNDTTNYMTNHKDIICSGKVNFVGGIAGCVNPSTTDYMNVIMSDEATMHGNIETQGGDVGGIAGRAPHLVGLQLFQFLGDHITANGDHVGGIIGMTELFDPRLDDSGDTANATLYVKEGTTIDGGSGSFVGGLVGNVVDLLNYDNVKLSCNQLIIKGNSRVGGLFGCVDKDYASTMFGDDGEIDLSYEMTNAGTIIVATGGYVGGFIGYINSNLLITYVKTHAIGTKSPNYSKAQIYNSGTGNYVGGWIGYINGTFNMYSGGIVDVAIHAANSDYVGGFIGWINGDCTVDSEESSMSAESGPGMDTLIGTYSAPSTVTVGTTSLDISDTDIIGGSYVGSLFGKIAGNFNVDKVKGNYMHQYYVNVTSTGGHIGGIAGYVSGNLTANRVLSANTTVDANGSYIGGLFGRIDGNVTLNEDAYCNGGRDNYTIKLYNTQENQYIGGVFGYVGGNLTLASGKSMYNGYSATTDPGDLIIEGNGSLDYVGGLVGFIQGSFMSYGRLTMRGSIKSEVPTWSAGGLIGRCYGTLSLNAGQTGTGIGNYVYGTEITIKEGMAVGGLVGNMYGGDAEYVTINSGYIKAKISGHYGVGGVVGNMSVDEDVIISNVELTSDVTITGVSEEDYVRMVGGVI
ncbi:MAG: hypothetical protein J6V40_02555, partial [Clostridia bacterium]|nr:hypothetical protein [Clostridia bacterium]